MWCSKKLPLKRSREISCDDEDEDHTIDSNTTDNLKTINNHIYFNGDITQKSMFKLANELRNLRNKLKLRELTFNTEQQPIYLHITTDGGDVYAAFSMVDCIKSLDVPVYSVVDGLVASAGTIISVAAKKKYICPNAYMLIHQLSSGIWGKMSWIEEQVSNLNKIMTHITDLYLKHTSLKEKELKKLLLTDITWNAEECIKKGIADEIYNE